MPEPARTRVTKRTVSSSGSPSPRDILNTRRRSKDSRATLVEMSQADVKISQIQALKSAMKFAEYYVKNLATSPEKTVWVYFYEEYIQPGIKEKIRDLEEDLHNLPQDETLVSLMQKLAQEKN